MNTSDFLIQKQFLSDEDQTPSYKNYFKISHIINKDKSAKISYSTDYPFSKNNGELFLKNSIEYINNYIFNQKGPKYKENLKYKIFDYIHAFSKSEHIKSQKNYYENIICFKNENAEPNAFLNKGDFNIIIDGIKGEDILNSLSRYKYNFYHYPGKEIIKEVEYYVICAIKLNYFTKIRDFNNLKQFKKFEKISELLSSKSNLKRIKEKIELNEHNELIFMLVTNSDFFQFDYMRYSYSNFKEDINNDVDKKYNIPIHLRGIDEISKLNVPVLLLFVPKTLEGNASIYKNKYIFKIEKQKNGLTWKNQKINKEIDKWKKKNKILGDKIALLKGKINIFGSSFIKKGEKKKRKIMLGKKRKRDDEK